MMFAPTLWSMFGTVFAIHTAIEQSVAGNFGCLDFLTPIAMFVGLKTTG